MITLALLLIGITPARAETGSFRDSIYASLREDSEKHGITNPLDVEASVRSLADRLAQLHQFRPPFGLGLENARPMMTVAGAAMMWLTHLTHLDGSVDHAEEDRRLGLSLATLVRRAIEEDRPDKAAETLRKYAERTFRHGVRVTRLLAVIDPDFASLVSPESASRVQKIFGHAAESLATSCATTMIEQ